MSAVTPCRIGPLVVGDGRPPLLIAGPCVIEGRDHALRHAERIAEIATKHGFAYCYKSSYDKANRTSAKGFRGPRLEEGLGILAEVKQRTGLPVLTDFHTAEEAAAVAKVADCLQVPAFLCRQTDLLQAAARTGRAVNVKKGQFMAPDQMAGVVEKVREAGGKDLLLTERGASFGYHELVVDFRSLPRMRALGHPVVFDGTHSVQRPGGLGDRSGGDRSEVPALLRAAAAVGVDGFFAEVHEDPDRAPSDGPNMLRLSDLDRVLGPISAILRSQAPMFGSSAPARPAGG